jgi:hypothetical protein
MAKSTKIKEPDFENGGTGRGDEDAARLAAMDQGLRNAREGRTVSMAQVRKLLPKWITNSSSRKDR